MLFRSDVIDRYREAAVFRILCGHRSEQIRRKRGDATFARQIVSQKRKVRSLPKILRRVAYPVEPFRFKFVQNDLSPPIPAGICERSGKRPGPLEQMEDCQANALQCSHRVVFICCSTGVTSEFWNEINQTPLLSSELRRSSTRWSAATRRWTQRSAGRRESPSWGPPHQP